MILPTGRSRTDDDAEFTAFVAASKAELGKTAWLLTGDAHLAAELVQDALVRTYVAWPRARQHDPLAYARRVLANSRIDMWRRRRREVLSAPASFPDSARVDESVVVEHRDELVRALARLSTPAATGRRAALPGGAERTRGRRGPRRQRRDGQVPGVPRSARSCARTWVPLDDSESRTR